MSHFRRLNYSISISVIITASLILQFDRRYDDVAILLVPGIVVEFILTTFFPFGDRELWGYTYQGWGANVVVYSFVVYALLLFSRATQWFHDELKAEAKHFGTSAIQQALAADSIAHMVSSTLKCRLSGIARR